MTSSQEDLDPHCRIRKWKDKKTGLVVHNFSPEYINDDHCARRSLVSCMEAVSEVGQAPLACCTTMLWPDGQITTVFHHDIDEEDMLISPAYAMAMSMDVSVSRLKNYFS